MLIAFFTGYSASVVRFFVDATSNLLCAVVVGRVATDRDAGRIKKLPEPTNKPFILGLADEILGLRARFFIWSPLRPTRLSFELEEIVVRWPMAYGSRSAIERKQNDYAKICRTRRPQTVH
jgi:hypothetical protein